MLRAARITAPSARTQAPPASSISIDPGRRGADTFGCAGADRVAPHCRWTSGRWQEFQRDWNEIQNIGRDIKLLSGHLARLDHMHAFAKVA